MKRYAIGDIHGGYKALVQCLNKVNFDFENDQLIVLGDVCDGWSEFLECIELLSKIKNLILILGNHDEWALKYATGNMLNKFSNDELHSWVHHGGKITKEKLDTIPNAKQTLIDFFKQSKMYHIQDNMCFVHAGIGFKTPIEKLPIYFYNWDRTFFEMMAADFRRMTGTEEQKLISNIKYDKVFIGHTPTTSSYYLGVSQTTPFIHKFVRAIDTGATFQGILTIMNIDTDDYWQSDPVYTLYPNEKGRN